MDIKEEILKAMEQEKEKIKDVKESIVKIILTLIFLAGGLVALLIVNITILSQVKRNYQEVQMLKTKVITIEKTLKDTSTLSLLNKKEIEKLKEREKLLNKNVLKTIEVVGNINEKVKKQDKEINQIKIKVIKIEKEIKGIKKDMLNKVEKIEKVLKGLKEVFKNF